jgi:hypothetical protein
MGLRAVPPNENTSTQQAATLALFKWPSFKLVFDFKPNQSGDSLGILPFGNTPKE